MVGEDFLMRSNSLFEKDSTILKNKILTEASKEGFAVVGQEIKSLADQSRQATEQVRNILDDTQE